LGALCAGGGPPGGAGPAAASLREQGVSVQTQVLASRLHRFADEDWRSVFQLAGDFIQSARPL
jgi:hypothetical protein